MARVIAEPAAEAAKDKKNSQDFCLANSFLPLKLHILSSLSYAFFVRLYGALRDCGYISLTIPPSNL